MILEAIQYTRKQCNHKEWGIEGYDGGMVYFDNINLIVGKNTTGKSRTLSAIRNVSKLLSQSLTLPELACSEFTYELRFKDKDTIYEYTISVENKIYVEEKLLVDGCEKLNRAKDSIYNEVLRKEEKLSVDSESISTSLHDIEKYPFLEKLYQWGNTLKLGTFSNHNEKNYLVSELSQLENRTKTTIKTANSVLTSFWGGRKKFGEEFINRLKSDMKALDYQIEKIELQQDSSGYGIHIKEEGLNDLTTQSEMSQGMYRALAFIIILNYSLMNKVSACILIDDLGEGLDFDRSKLLIDLLVNRIEGSNIQIFTATNDRYIMNKLPLKYWSIAERHPNKTVFYNYHNSTAVFDDFAYTGLNNFDFFATEFYVKGFGSTEE